MPNTAAFADTAATEAALLLAATDRLYFMPTCDNKVTYVSGPGARRFAAQAHMWLAEYEIEVDGEIVGTRKTAKGALALLVKLSDAEYRKVMA